MTMICIQCNKEIKYTSTFQKRRNKNFYCNMKCYLEFVRREKEKNVDFFDKIDTEEKAYWLGFFVADGNVHLKNNVMQIGLSRKDAKHLEKFAFIFDKKLKFYIVDGKHRMCRMGINSASMKKNLISKGVVPRKTYCDISSVFDYIPYLLRKHFIRGVFDGDGCISGKGKNVAMSIAGQSNFIEKLQNLIIGDMGLSKNKIEKHNMYSVIKWSGKRQIKIFYDWFYNSSNVFLERKKEKMEEILRTTEKRSSIFHGVTWHKTLQKWNAYLWVKSKRIHLGYFIDEKQAALAYDEAIQKYNKPKYKLNNVGDQ